MDQIAKFKPLGFSDLAGWETEDFVDALNAFVWSAKRISKKPYKTKKLGVDALALKTIALKTLEGDFEGLKNQTTARQFFEDNFAPHEIVTPEGKGFVTGYFEPEISASRIKTEKFQFPILKRPNDLVAITDKERPDHMSDEFFFARKTELGFEEFPDRPAIELGALDGQDLEIYWFESRIDIFFIHIQGSARLNLTDGTSARISYDGKSGQVFSPIGKILIDRGEIKREDITMQSIRDWLRSHPDQADDLMRENKSFIFFQIIDHPAPELGPVAAAGVPLTAMRSLAVDHRLQTFGVPIFISTHSPLPKSTSPFRQLMFAQDTGSAIVGPARGDIFTGTGESAADIAGSVKHDADFVILLPKSS